MLQVKRSQQIEFWYCALVFLLRPTLMSTMAGSKQNLFKQVELRHFLGYFYPSNGRQNVLASASNKSPHFPQCPPFPEYPHSFFFLSSWSFFCCSTDTSGTVTSSPALISKGLQSSPTKWAFIQSFGWRSFDTSTKWIFCLNQLDRLLLFRPTLQFLLSHLCS